MVLSFGPPQLRRISVADESGETERYILAANDEHIAIGELKQGEDTAYVRFVALREEEGEEDNTVHSSVVVSFGAYTVQDSLRVLQPPCVLSEDGRFVFMDMNTFFRCRVDGSEVENNFMDCRCPLKRMAEAYCLAWHSGQQSSQVVLGSMYPKGAKGVHLKICEVAAFSQTMFGRTWPSFGFENRIEHTIPRFGDSESGEEFRVASDGRRFIAVVSASSVDLVDLDNPSTFRSVTCEPKLPFTGSIVWSIIHDSHVIFTQRSRMTDDDIEGASYSYSINLQSGERRIVGLSDDLPDFEGNVLCRSGHLLSLSRDGSHLSIARRILPGLEHLARVECLAIASPSVHAHHPRLFDYDVTAMSEALLHN